MTTLRTFPNLYQTSLPPFVDSNCGEPSHRAAVSEPVLMWVEHVATDRWQGEFDHGSLPLTQNNGVLPKGRTIPHPGWIDVEGLSVEMK